MDLALFAQLLNSMPTPSRPPVCAPPYPCIARCPCPETLAFAMKVRELPTEADVKLFVDMLCGNVCNVPGINTTQEQPPPLQRSCAEQLRAAVCNERVTSAMRMIKLILLGLNAVAPTPTWPTWSTALSLLIDTVQAFCATQDNSAIEAAIKVICTNWPVVQGSLSTVITSPLLPPSLKDYLTAIFSQGSPLSNALNACCVAGQVPSGEPPRLTPVSGSDDTSEQRPPPDDARPTPPTTTTPQQPPQSGAGREALTRALAASSTFGQWS